MSALMRFGAASGIGLLLTAAVFLLLERLVNPDHHSLTSSPSLPLVELVRVREEPQLQRKERVKPKKPKPEKQPPKPKIRIPAPKVKAMPQQIQTPKLDFPLDLSATNGLNDALVSAGGDGRVVNANVMPLVHIEPVYPKRAKMLHKEGYVILEYRITRQGTVADIEVMESEPEGLFESAARKALSKWKFRPKMDAGRAVEQWARVRINFDLER